MGPLGEYPIQDDNGPLPNCTNRGKTVKGVLEQQNKVLVPDIVQRAGRMVCMPPRDVGFSKGEEKRNRWRGTWLGGSWTGSTGDGQVCGSSQSKEQV